MHPDTPTPALHTACNTAADAAADVAAALDARAAATAARAAHLTARAADIRAERWATLATETAVASATAARGAADVAAAVAGVLASAYVDHAATHATLCHLFATGTPEATAAARDAHPYVLDMAQALARIHDAPDVATARAAREDVARCFGAVSALARAAWAAGGAT
jgi:hypothetical protein